MFAKTAMLVAALAVGSSAQTYNVTYLQGLAQFLGGQGFTSLAQAVQSSLNSSGTINLLNNINGTGKTLLAPTNTAFTGFQAKYPNASDPNFLGDVLSYHLLSGSFPGSSFSAYPNHTVARTYLNDSAVVQLEGNKSQALVFSIEGGATRVLNQNTNVTITGTTSYQNLLIQIVDSVIDIPSNITNAFAAQNLTDAPQVFNSLSLTDPFKYAKGMTVFVPNDAAFAALNSTIAQLAATNITQVQQVFANHVINGTTVYSTELGSGTYTSIGGQKFNFSTGANGTFVTSGNYTAQIVLADIVLDNGVMHIIDHVLLNNATNPSAASSAYSSATASASSAQETGPIGNNAGSNGTGTSSGSSNSSSGKKNGAEGRAAIAQTAVILAGVFAGVVALL